MKNFLEKVALNIFIVFYLSFGVIAILMCAVGAIILKVYFDLIEPKTT